MTRRKYNNPYVSVGAAIGRPLAPEIYMYNIFHLYNERYRLSYIIGKATNRKEGRQAGRKADRLEGMGHG